MKKLLKILGIIAVLVVIAYLILEILSRLFFENTQNFINAANRNDIPAMEKLIKEGYNPKQTIFGKNHLRIYIGTIMGEADGKQPQAEVVKFLLEEGISPNSENDGSPSALHISILSNQYDVVRLLLEAGADASYEVRGKDNLSALDIALRLGRYEMVPLIEKYHGTLHYYSLPEKETSLRSCLSSENCKTWLKEKYSHLNF